MCNHPTFRGLGLGGISQEILGKKILNALSFCWLKAPNNTRRCRGSVHGIRCCRILRYSIAEHISDRVIKDVTDLGRYLYAPEVSRAIHVAVRGMMVPQ